VSAAAFKQFFKDPVHRKHGWTTVYSNASHVSLMHLTAGFRVRFENVYLPTGCSELDSA
jgi:hypothetical protein